MTIKRKQPYGAIDERRLAEFEKALQAPLPGDYRSFLLEFNGAHFDECENFDEIRGGTCLDVLFGLHTGPTYEHLDEMFSNFRDALPPNVVPIGADPFGNYFALDLDKGCVYFVDHEALPAELNSLPQIASTFSALLERAGGRVEPYVEPQTVEDALASRDAEGLRKLLVTGHSGVGFVHRAVHTGSVDVVRLVLEHGGDPDERGGIGGETPLFVAALHGQADMVDVLLEHGAQPDARCDAGGTAMEMAAPYPEVVERLARAGATPTTPRLRELVRRILGRGHG